jgi:SEL1 protein
MALGYRHLHGAGVPKSCWAAASYYQAVAAAVVEGALADGGVPHVSCGAAVGVPAGAGPRHAGLLPRRGAPPRPPGPRRRASKPARRLTPAAHPPIRWSACA